MFDSPVHAYCLRVDTGGAYTDAVLWSEALTTRHDLSIGVADAVEIALARDVKAVEVEGRRLFVSATLAAVASGRPRIAAEPKRSGR